MMAQRNGFFFLVLVTGITDTIIKAVILFKSILLVPWELSFLRIDWNVEQGTS